jgi:heme o synthase
LQVNALTAGLGVANIALYASIYTPLKQIHPINTWIGAVVGAVPPLMGWAAATGSLDPGAAFLAAVLYFWQLPHFMALAWLCKDDYARGGHRMISLFDPTGKRTAGVALRNALYLVPLGFAAVSAGLVHAAFTYESVGLSYVLALSASVFYSRPTAQVCAPGTSCTPAQPTVQALLALVCAETSDGVLVTCRARAPCFACP